MATKPKLPFRVESPRLPFKPLHSEILERKERAENERLEKEAQEKHDAWLTALKKKARENLNLDREHLRIAWTNRFRIPKHSSFEDYTLEEAVIEAWEQWYYENPKSLELKGIFKKTNQKTGYAFYETGDPIIDALEREFSEGNVPDLDKAFGHIKNGEDIFRAKVFRSTSGQLIAARQGIEGVKENEKGEKITEAGTKVEHEDYNSDDWLKSALNEDESLKDLAAKLGINNA